MSFLFKMPSMPPMPPIQEPKVEDVPSMEDEACLLYTSPSPRDRQKSRMPSSA